MDNAKLLEVIETVNSTDYLTPALIAARASLVEELSNRLIAGSVKTEVVESPLGPINIYYIPKTFSKVPAIKLVRAIFGLGLKEAKEVVEKYGIYDPGADYNVSPSNEEARRIYKLTTGKEYTGSLYA